MSDHAEELAARNRVEEIILKEEWKPYTWKEGDNPDPTAEWKYYIFEDEDSNVYAALLNKFRGEIESSFETRKDKSVHVHFNIPDMPTFIVTEAVLEQKKQEIGRQYS